jgi:hypothetical protein
MTSGTDVAPVVESETAPAAAERAPGFTAAGKDYTFPGHIPAGWGLTYLRLRYSSSENHAVVWALAQLLTPEQRLALEQDSAVTREELAAAIETCRRALFGEVLSNAGS